MPKDIFDVISSEEAAYQLPIEVVDGWSWSMKDHIRRTVLYKNSQFEQDNENRTKRPFKNIVRPILNIQYRTEGFDVKDIEIFVDNSEHYYKSFLLKKFHEKWALENEMDTFIDEVVESFVDFGGVLVKNVKGVRPEVVKLQTLAFCDQTDLLNGTFAIKHYLSPAQLREMTGWDKTAIEIAISAASAQKQQDKTSVSARTTVNLVEVYEVHGQFPAWWLGEGGGNEVVPQMHVVSFYQNASGQKQGLTFAKKREPKLPFKFLARDKIFGRALGFGGVEELVEPQAWTNYAEKRIMEILDIASKLVYKTDDINFKNKNSRVTELENGQVLELTKGSDIAQLDTTPRSLAVFDNSLADWERHAQQVGAAGEALLGESPSAGTPFKLQELVTAEAKGLHHYRRGKLAVFMDEIYRDWILPHLAKQASDEQEFLAELSAEEVQEVADRIITARANRVIKERILGGAEISPEEAEEIRLRMRQTFLTGGQKQFLKIIKNEMTKPLGVRTNIVGKQKNLALLTDKLVNVVRQFLATPELRQDPTMVKLLNVILESSGLSPVMLGGQPVLTQPTGATTEPLQQLGEAVTEKT